MPITTAAQTPPRAEGAEPVYVEDPAILRKQRTVEVVRAFLERQAEESGG